MLAAARCRRRVRRVEVADCASQIGSGALPVERLPSARPRDTRTSRQARELDARSTPRCARCRVPVIGRIADKALWLDLRCLERDEAAFVAQLAHLDFGIALSRMIVGTAGHIDHGKTTLVSALTGVDTDRLQGGEGARHLHRAGLRLHAARDGDVLGFVDVPGHERFVHNMLAGATGIDFALLVVAADDGVMPQTREHLAILDLLGVSRGAVALTKIDRVDARPRRRGCPRDRSAARRDAARRRAHLRRRCPRCRGSPASSRLRDALRSCRRSAHARAQRRTVPARDRPRLHAAGPRHDRTGTIVSGAVRAGDTVDDHAIGRAARVRGIHAQNRPVEAAHAGERAAINLAGVETGDLHRGDWLADARALATTSRIDVALRTASERPIADASAVHVHLGTARTTARIHWLAEATRRTGRAQLVLDAPICAAPGDRFIVRDAQAATTIGGGTRARSVCACAAAAQRGTHALSRRDRAHARR